ncbi:MAG: hypothetical protein L6W00_00150 [Lentisphaeria bacterium]|nr:MAG: hypothetical protein L6W00_00150 [Lentisphaeria bacterium]
MEHFDPAQLPCPILLRGDARTAYRDPAVFYRDGWFHLFSRWWKSAMTTCPSSIWRLPGAAT